jgi:hypothetical protein
MTLGTGIALFSVWGGLSAISYTAKSSGSPVFHVVIAVLGVGTTVFFALV